MTDRALPDADAQARRDADWRDGRKRLLEEMHQQHGVPRYRSGSTKNWLRGAKVPTGRRALVAFYRQRNRLFTFLLDGHPYRGNLAFLRVAYASMGEPEASLLRRWRRKRDRWRDAGCPRPYPWEVLERR